MFRLNLEELEESLKQAKIGMDVRKTELISIISPFWSDDLEQKRKDELVHAAKLVLCLKTNIRLEKMTESPDFIISESDKIIGLEVSKLLTKRVEVLNYIQKIFDDASQKFRDTFPKLKLLVNFWLKPGFNYKKQTKIALIQEINTYIHNKINKVDAVKPDFIESIDIQPHSDVLFYYNEGAYSQTILEEDIVLSAIEKKESKINDYIKNFKTEFQWLLLVNSQLGSDSFGTYDFKQIEEIQTRFEHVFILNDFDCEIIKIK